MQKLPATRVPLDDETKGLLLGALGVLMFAMTLPMTRLAVGTSANPQLAGYFITAGRACIAAVLSAIYLSVVRAPLPAMHHWPAMFFTSAGVVIGFPLFSSLALRHVNAVHATVTVGVLPLATAVVGAWLNRQRPSPGFWASGVTGSALVVIFTLVDSRTRVLAAAPIPWWADVLLLLAMLSAAFGYALGAKLSRSIPAEQVICWALLIALPVAAPMAWASRPEGAITATAWAGFSYLCVFSMWLGFFAWYRGLALGGTVRVSQVQLLQPFFGMLFAHLFLGEHVDAASFSVMVAVIICVYVGKKMPTT